MLYDSTSDACIWEFEMLLFLMYIDETTTIADNKTIVSPSIMNLEPRPLFLGDCRANTVILNEEGKTKHFD